MAYGKLWLTPCQALPPNLRSPDGAPARRARNPGTPFPHSAALHAGYGAAREPAFALPSRRRRVADRHHERELVVKNIGGRRRERLRAAGERQRLFVERGGAGALHDAARQHTAVAVEAECEPRRALLAGGAGRIALVALELGLERALPAHDRGGRGPRHPAGRRRSRPMG